MTAVAVTNLVNKKPHSSLEHAHQSAVNPAKSQFGYAITSKNPFDEKLLKQKIRDIDREKRIHSTEMFWKQRQFFIDKAFDENEKLRYATLKKEKSSKLSLPEIAIQTPTSDSGSSGSSDWSKQTKKMKLSNAVFPKIIEEQDVRPKTSLRELNLLKKQKTLLELKSRSDLVPSPVPYTSRPNSSESFNTATANPILMPLTYDTEDKRKIQRSKRTKRANTKKSKLTERKENKSPRTMEKENSFGGRTSMPIRDSLKLSELENINNSDLITLVQTANESMPDELKLDLSNIMDTDLKRAKMSQTKLQSKSTESLTTDELLLKLTMSLPMRLLLKTDQTLNDLSSALGFEDRRAKLIEREKTTYADRPVLKDERFQRLMDTLQKHDKDH